MVRIKHRYLLLNILYPEPPPHPKISQPSQHSSRNIIYGASASSSSSSTAITVPEILQFHRPTPDDLTPQLLVRAIRDQILYLYGDYGAAVTSTGLLVKYLSPATSTFILRCSRANHRVVWSALTFMTHLPLGTNPKQSPGQSCVMHVVRVSGTIRKAEEEVVRRARVAILRARGAGGGFSGGWDEDEGGGAGAEASEGGGRKGGSMGLGAGIEDDDDDEEEHEDEDVSMDEGG
ncbi:MAG: hypothetical protein L6R37_000790 [Teloschistes peruensis]|nr:MAG: hypothetical protein L6R37_000790 [Teloschistes peruensis]